MPGGRVFTLPATALPNVGPDGALPAKVKKGAAPLRMRRQMMARGS